MRAHLWSRRSLLTAGLAWPLAAAAQTPPTFHPESLMPAFWAAYDATAVEGRAEALWARFFEPNLAVYHQAGARIELRHVVRWLPELETMVAPVRRLSNDFEMLAGPALARFLAALPDFDAAHAKVVVLPSLFRFDGHLEPGGNELPLFVGLDGIVKYHGPTPDLGVFLSHELFHLYQAQAMPELATDAHPPVFVNLWIEGLATYASERLNPGASRLHVLLDDQPLAAAPPETVRAVAAFTLAHLDATDDATLGKLFSGGAGGEFPGRAGYLVGLEIARRAGRGKDLRALARLSRPGTRVLMARELAQIARG